MHKVRNPFQARKGQFSNKHELCVGIRIDVLEEEMATGEPHKFTIGDNDRVYSEDARQVLKHIYDYNNKGANNIVNRNGHPTGVIPVKHFRINGLEPEVYWREEAHKRLAKEEKMDRGDYALMLFLQLHRGLSQFFEQYGPAVFESAAWTQVHRDLPKQTDVYSAIADYFGDPKLKELDNNWLIDKLHEFDDGELSAEELISVIWKEVKKEETDD
jgi:hypothetical protein